MASFPSLYWKRPAWIAGGGAVVVLIAGIVGLTHALATIPSPESAKWRGLAIESDPYFSEASLTRFGATLEPSALALAERYAPARPVVLANNSTKVSELSYENDPGPLPAGFRDLTKEQAAAANSAVAFSKAPNPAAASFRLPGIDDVARTRALDCLTMAVYYEAASESGEGQAAVAQVVLNRLRNAMFPKTVCGVVFEGSKLPTGCQFSFTCDGSLARRPSEAGWKRARDVAQRALGGYVEKSIGEATHYHTMWVVPYWQPSVVKLTQIGAHIFYRWPGEAGLPSAFHQQYAGIEEAPPPIAGLVGDHDVRRMVVSNAPSTPAPTIAAPAPTIELADLSLPKAAPVVSVAAASTPAAAPKPSFFGPPPGARSRSTGVGHW